MILQIRSFPTSSGLSTSKFVLLFKWDTINVAVDQFLTILDTSIPGCVDNTPGDYTDIYGNGSYLACNYDPNAQANDGSCQYRDACNNCESSNTFNQYLGCDGVCYNNLEEVLNFTELYFSFDRFVIY